MKLIADEVFDKYSERINYDMWSINKDLITDISLKPSLDKYILLEYYSYWFDLESLLNIYYNKFYWYSKFMSEYINKYGKDDLSLVEERFKLFEEGDRYPNIDWAVIEGICNQTKT